jgi:enoyl-CoA hydratase/carnithine racemase
VSDDELAAELTGIVLRVPGVLQAYDARPALTAAVTDAAAALRAGLASRLPLVPAVPAVSAAPVAVGRSAGALVVTVTIAVSGTRPAAETCREVYEVLAEALAARPEGEGATVSVQVARIG